MSCDRGLSLFHRLYFAFLRLFYAFIYFGNVSPVRKKQIPRRTYLKWIYAVSFRNGIKYCLHLQEVQ